MEKYLSSLKYYWRYVAHRGVSYSDEHGKFDRGFLIPDPWGMESDRETTRFVETNRLIETTFGRPRRMLEIGGAEGHQSSHLVEICDELVSTDVSARALSRARRRCPSATFLNVNVLADDDEIDLPPFDLVLACEVLYYVSDVPAALKRMEALGRNCLVTFCKKEADMMMRHMEHVPIAGRDEIHHSETMWHVMWWRGGVPAKNGSANRTPD